MADEQPATIAPGSEMEPPPPPEVAPRTGTAAARWLGLLAISAAALTVTAFLEFSQGSPSSPLVVILFSSPPAAVLVGAVVGAGRARRGPSVEGFVRLVTAVLGLLVGVGGFLIFLYGYGWSFQQHGGAGLLATVPVIVASVGCLIVKGPQPGPVVPTNEGTAAFVREARQGHIFVCGSCGKPLSPYWRSCLRCKASFDQFPPVATDRQVGWGH